MGMLTSTRWSRLALSVAACLWLVVGFAGCAKSKQARAAAVADRQAAEAIARYGEGAAQANAAHRQVLLAFAAANASTSLSDYRASLRDRALPALDGYLQALGRVPTATAELQAIHGNLLQAYRTARSDLATFEQGLQDPSGLPRFDAIRTTLQAAVRSYEAALAAYYGRHGRRLQLASTPPVVTAATATQAAAAATPTLAAVPVAATPSSGAP
jgi:hypothetical protein